MPDPSAAAATLRARADAVIKGTSAGACYDPELVRCFALAIEEGEEGEVILVKRRFQDRFKRDFQTSYLNTLIAKELTALRAAAAAANDSPYHLTSTGTMQTNLANAIIMMQALPLAWNSFSSRVFLTQKSPWGTTGVWTDHDDIGAAEWCQQQKLNVDKNTVADASSYIAKRRLPWYHPVAEYLCSVKWDGVPRLDNWLTTYLGVPDSEYVRNVAAKWMISAVKRVHEPGCQADYTLVLEGGQGKRKSGALRALCHDEDWFTDDLGEVGTKDSALNLLGKWIIEISELDAFKRAEMTTIKAWLVRRFDHLRPPYGRRPEDFPRHNIFAATTNRFDWLNDDTGGRRFWPVRVGQKIDIEGLTAVRDQLWAEAVFRFHEGELIYFSDEIEQQATVEQGDRQQRDSWTDQIEAWAANPIERNHPDYTPDIRYRSQVGKIYASDIPWHCMGIVAKDANEGHTRRATRVLKLAGYETHRTPPSEADPDGKRPEYWTRTPR
jgi:putative DNA primase/helicase